MKITDVKTVLLTGPCTNDPFLSEARKRRSAAFIEIHTDTELIGIGETYTGYFIPEVVPEIAVMKVCEDYNLFFFEEPLHYNDPSSPCR